MLRKRYRFLIILGAVLMQVSIGAIYSWTLFNEPLHEKFGWDYSSILLTYSLTIFVFAFTTLFSGRLLDKYGPRKIGIIGGILYGVGVILTSRATSIYQLYLFYGVIAGIGVGFVYVCPLSTCIKWFPDKKGLVTGIVIGAFGLGSLIFKDLIQTSITTIGVSETFFKVGPIYLLLTISGAILLFPPPKDSMNNSKKFKTHSVRTIIKTKRFYFIWGSYFLGCISGLLVIGSATEIGIKLASLSPVTASGIVIIIGIFNATGRLFWGFISDHLGSKKTGIIIFILTVVTMFIGGFISFNLTVFYIFVGIITFCFGGLLVIYPTLTSDNFGTKNLGGNYGVIYQAYGFAALLGPLVLKLANGYQTSFLFSGILATLGFFLLTQVKK